MLAQGYDEEYAKVVATYLALMVDRLSDYNSTLCVWAVSGEFVAHTFGKQALPMVWDYFELNPGSESTGGWNGPLLLVRTQPRKDYSGFCYISAIPRQLLRCRGD